MAQQHVIEHLKEIDFWKNLPNTNAGSNLDWCDRLACETIVMRLKAKSGEQIDDQIKHWIANGDHARWELNHDGVSVPTEQPPELCAVIERANEVSALMKKKEESN